MIGKCSSSPVYAIPSTRWWAGSRLGTASARRARSRAPHSWGDCGSGESLPTAAQTRPANRGARTDRDGRQARPTEPPAVWPRMQSRKCDGRPGGAAGGQAAMAGSVAPAAEAQSWPRRSALGALTPDDGRSSQARSRAFVAASKSTMPDALGAKIPIATLHMQIVGLKVRAR